VKITQLLTVTDYFNQNAEGLSIDQLDDPRQANLSYSCNESENKRLTTVLFQNLRYLKIQKIEITGYLKATDYKNRILCSSGIAHFFTRPEVQYQYLLGL